MDTYPCRTSLREVKGSDLEVPRRLHRPRCRRMRAKGPECSGLSPCSNIPVPSKGAGGAPSSDCGTSVPIAHAVYVSAKTRMMRLPSRSRGQGPQAFQRLGEGKGRIQGCMSARDRIRVSMVFRICGEAAALGLSWRGVAVARDGAGLKEVTEAGWASVSSSVNWE